MKRFEIRSIGIASSFRFLLAVGVVAGLLASIAALAMGATPKDLGLDMGILNQGFGVGTAIVTAVIISIGYGIISGLAGIIIAFLYNLFSAAVGGIVIRINEEE